MKVLVIPDIHGRKFWREAVENNIEQVEKIIFLGDYLDPYQQEIDNEQETMECNDFYDCQNLLQMLNDIVSLKKNEPDKFVLLCGNHTCSYIWPKFHAATRTDYRHWKGYHKFFSENLNLFNLIWIENNCIFSHAGISEGWTKSIWNYLDFPKNESSSIKKVSNILKETPLNKFNKYYIDAISSISYYRGGDSLYGSCEWADLREHINMEESEKQLDFIPIGEDGIFQVFGHTQLKTPIVTDKWVCLDCRKGFIFDTITHECNSCL